MTRSSVQLECKTQGKSTITIVKGVGEGLRRAAQLLHLVSVSDGEPTTQAQLSTEVCAE